MADRLMGMVAPVLAALVLALCFGLAGERAYAQQEQATAAPEGPASGRQTAFRSVSGAEGEQVSGLTLMVTAYGLIWLLVLAYVLRLAALQAASEREQRRLERLMAVDKPPGTVGDTEPGP